MNEAKGFASTNVVLGIGSYTYQYNTRDTFGFAVKSTYGEIGGVPCQIFKNPKTDKGEKKSAKGLLRVNEDFTLSEGVDWQDEGGFLETVFLNGEITKVCTLVEVRNRLNNKLVRA